MAYIYLDELKDVLPAIMDQWIDGDDESWEWIFQEIEQKCHVGKRKKDKKQKKYAERIDELTRKVDDVIPKIMGDFDSRINAQTKRIDGLSNKVSNLNDKVNRMDNDIRATKLMAQTAKQRTEVDYTKRSKEKSDADVVQEVYNRMAGRGATREELDTFRNLIQKYDALEKKEIPVTKKACETCRYAVLPGLTEPCKSCVGNGKWKAKEKTCETCKYIYAGDRPPCTLCNEDRDKWEAKDNE